MPSQELEIAITIARQAGTLLRDQFRKTTDIRLKEDGSQVSDADILSHDFIIGKLSAAFPHCVILSEESPNALQTLISEKPTWIIDPLDATSNFLCGIPLFAVSIAFVENKKTVLGVIYDPVHDELFAAQKGAGATLNGHPIHVSQKALSRAAMLFAGRGHKEKDRGRHADMIAVLERQTTYFRRIGCATLMLAYVAAGRADGVILTGNDPWDLMAGTLLIEEAGGQTSDYRGQVWAPTSEDLVATNGVIHQKISEITRVLQSGLV